MKTCGSWAWRYSYPKIFVASKPLQKTGRSNKDKTSSLWSPIDCGRRERSIMGTFEDVQAAEKRMNEGKAALERYTDGPADEPPGHEVHLQLLQKLRIA